MCVCVCVCVCVLVRNLVVQNLVIATSSPQPVTWKCCNAPRVLAGMQLPQQAGCIVEANTQARARAHTHTHTHMERDMEMLAAHKQP